MLHTQVRPGAYYDSVLLMQLQRALTALPGVEQAGVVMGTPANKAVLAHSSLLTPEAERAAADDLIIVVQSEQSEHGIAALAQIDSLLAHRRSADVSEEYRPKSLASAVQMLPEARWVLVSVPGRFAAGVAQDALQLGRHVFLYSDNVSLEDEIALKQRAEQRGLLVMGPDCGTAIINGVGMGFANRVRRGKIGLVGASGTGLQMVVARIHQLGGGITHAIGTGGRDLTERVGAITTRQALALLNQDPETRVIVLLSKPPAPTVAEDVLHWVSGFTKPVVIDFIGYRPDYFPAAHIHFAETLDTAAHLAVELSQCAGQDMPTPPLLAPSDLSTGKYLRGLFSGGTLAYEALHLLRDYLPAVYSNAPLDKRFKLEQATVSQEHTIVDLGEDEFTIGRLHPMLDNELRIKRLHQEASDPETAILLLDVVLGDGAHPDPASELGPAISQARAAATQAGRSLDVVVLVVGTDDDPQGLDRQIEQLQTAGAHVEVSSTAAVRAVGEKLRFLNQPTASHPIELAALTTPVSAINIGLESFAVSLLAQGAAVVQVEWRPPAGGNERLAALLARMKRQ